MTFHYWNHNCVLADFHIDWKQLICWRWLWQNAFWTVLWPHGTPQREQSAVSCKWSPVFRDPTVGMWCFHYYMRRNNVVSYH